MNAHQNASIVRIAAAAALATALLAVQPSCSVGPDYKRPELRVPTTYKSVTTAETRPVQLPTDWWRLFGDAGLVKLEEQALEANLDLQAAMARIVQARAAAGITRSQFFPVITLDPSLDESRPAANRGAGGNKTSKSTTSTDIKIPFDLTYEVDIWGRVRRSYQASLAQVQASSYDYQVVLNTMAADVAQDYFSIRSLDAQSQILDKTVESYRRQLSLTETQFNAGLVGRIDVVQAETQLHSALVTDADIRRQRADLEHALAILLGRPPAEVTVPVRPLDLSPPVIPAGLPAELLRRRPDVAEAEQNLAAASAQIGVATAAFYPTVRLTGAAGFESMDVQHALDWKSRIWSITPSVSIPIFEGGKLEAGLQQAKGRYDELLATYRNSVLGAFRDVEDALTDLHLRADEAQEQEQAVVAAREYLRLARIQYDRGLASYLLVIDAQRTLLTNELSAVQILNQRLASTVLLIKALGGGWDAERVATTQPSTQPAAP
jgi:multidrug efflux system outer membrane protein